MPEAIKELQSLASTNNYLNELIVHEARYKSLRRKTRMGMVPLEFSEVEENKLRSALLELIDEIEQKTNSAPSSTLSDQAKTLLFAASHDNRAEIRSISTKDGWQIQTNNKVLFSKGTPRERILWKDALSQLCAEDLAEKLDTSQKLSEIFEMTKKGFEVADSISEISSSQNQKFGLFTDPRDGQEYKTVELFDQVWLAQNLNFDAGEGCSFYDDDPANREKYGRLYTWDSAQRACPPGWRLPSMEEFDSLIAKFGRGKEAYDALMDDGASGFNVLLAGIQHSDGDFMSIGKYASFWVSKESENKVDQAYFFYFRRDSNVSWHINLKAFGHSVRCVKL